MLLDVSEQHTWDNRNALIRFPETIFVLLTTTAAEKGPASVYEIHVAGAISMSQEGKGPHSDDKESFKELKDKSNFSFISDFRKLNWVVI